MTHSIISWRTFFILLGLSLLSVCAVFPYVLTVQHDALSQVPVPIPVLFVAQFVQTGILFAITIFIGLYLAKKTGFRVVFPDRIGLPVLSGILTAIAIFATDFIFTSYGAAVTTKQNLAPIWQKLLAALYGGVAEEILLRLFLMTLFVWIAMKLARRTSPSSLGVWLSIILSSIIFGLGHLPITASLTAITPLIVIRAVVLNGIGGLVFGWLYWKRGLGAAMIAHGTTDVFLLTILPLVFALAFK